MDVQMGNAFSAFLSVVYNDSKPIVQALPLGHLSGSEKQMAKQRLILLFSHPNSGNWFFWNHQSMKRGLWGYVFDDYATPVFVKDIRGNLTVDDLFEKSAHGKSYLIPKLHLDDQIRREER